MGSMVLYRTFGTTEIELTIHDDLTCTANDGERFVPPVEMIEAALTKDMSIFEPHRAAFQGYIDEHFTRKYGAPKDKTAH